MIKKIINKAALILGLSYSGSMMENLPKVVQNFCCKHRRQTTVAKNLDVCQRISKEIFSNNSKEIFSNNPDFNKECRDKALSRYETEIPPLDYVKFQDAIRKQYVEDVNCYLIDIMNGRSLKILHKSDPLNNKYNALRALEHIQHISPEHRTMWEQRIEENYIAQSEKEIEEALSKIDSIFDEKNPSKYYYWENKLLQKIRYWDDCKSHIHADHKQKIIDSIKRDADNYFNLDIEPDYNIFQINMMFEGKSTMLKYMTELLSPEEKKAIEDIIMQKYTAQADKYLHDRFAEHDKEKYLTAESKYNSKMADLEEFKSITAEHKARLEKEISDQYDIDLIIENLLKKCNDFFMSEFKSWTPLQKYKIRLNIFAKENSQYTDECKSKVAGILECLLNEEINKHIRMQFYLINDDASLSNEAKDSRKRDVLFAQEIEKLKTQLRHINNDALLTQEEKESIKNDIILAHYNEQFDIVRSKAQEDPVSFVKNIYALHLKFGVSFYKELVQLERVSIIKMIKRGKERDIVPIYFDIGPQLQAQYAAETSAALRVDLGPIIDLIAITAPTANTINNEKK